MKTIEAPIRRERIGNVIDEIEDLDGGGVNGSEKNAMKRVEATIRPERVTNVISALEDIGHGNVAVTQVCSHGEELGFTRQWRGMSYVVDVLPKVKIELLVREALLQRVIYVIRENATTGTTGDGMITVTSVESAIEVQTGVDLCTGLRLAV